MKSPSGRTADRRSYARWSWRVPLGRGGDEINEACEEVSIALRRTWLDDDGEHPPPLTFGWDHVAEEDSELLGRFKVDEPSESLVDHELGMSWGLGPFGG